MQSYGVLTFVSMASGRPQRDPCTLAIEKRTVVGGAVCGMLALYGNLHTGHALRALPGVDYQAIDAVGRLLHLAGQIGCYALSVAAVLHVTC